MPTTSTGRSTQKKFDQIAPRVAELAAAGHGRNDIARQLGVSSGTVTRAAQHANVTFRNVVAAETHERAQVTREKTTIERRESFANVWGALQGLSAAVLVKRLQANPDEIDVRALLAIAEKSADKWMKYSPEADPEIEQMGESRAALDALHNAIVASAMSLATPEELALMGGTDSDEEDFEDDEEEDEGGYTPHLRPNGEYH